MRKRALTLLLTFACVSTPLVVAEAPPARAESEALDQLLENVAYWRARGRMDKVAETWRKVLRSDPRHADALADLALWHARQGDVDVAKGYLARLEAAHPGDARVTEVRRAVGVGATYQDKVREAREHARNGRYDQAVSAYRQAFGGAAPDGALGLEFYQTLGGSGGGWEEARVGLERLAASRPGDVQYELALARHLTYRETTRRDGVARLARLSATGTEVETVRAAWRQALMWLNATKSDVAAFQTYLARYPDDPEVAEQMARVIKDTSPVTRPADVRKKAVNDGFEALSAEDADKAEALFARALQRNKEDVEALTGLAVVHLQREEFASAKELLERVKALAPQRRELWARSLESATFWDLVAKGKLALAEKRWVDAETLLEEAAAASKTEQAHALLLLGAAKVEREQFSDAEAIYERILTEQPDHVPALKALVEVQLRRGKGTEALAANARLRAASAEDAYDDGWVRAEDLRRRAARARKEGHDGQALSLLRIARETAPESREVLVDLVYVALAMNAHEDARATVAALRKRYPDDDDGKLADVWVTVAERRYEQALEVLRTVSRGRFDDDLLFVERRLGVQTRAEQALAMAARGKLVAARTVFDELERDVADEPELLGLVASGLADLGMHDRALGLMNTAISSARKATPPLLLQLAALLHKAGKEEELLAVLRELDGQPLTPEQRRGLSDLQVAHAVRRADIAREQGQLSRGYNVLAASLREHPEDMKLLAGLGRVLLGAGELDEARKVFNRILERDADNVEARQGVIEAAARQHDEPRARAVAEEGLRRRGWDPRMHLVAARMAVLLGEDGEAMDHYGNALALVESQVGRVSREVGERPTRIAAGLGADPSAYDAGGNDVSLRTEIVREMDELQARYNTQITVNAETRYRPGEAGLGELFAARAPIGLSVPVGYHTRIGFTATPTLVSAGDLDLGDAETGERFGTTGVDLFGIGAGSFPQAEQGVALELSLRYDTVRFAFGTTPLGFQRQNLIGSVEWRDQFGDVGLRLHGFRDAVRDSVLSWSGATDVGTGATFGGLTKNGGRADVSLTLDTTLLYLYGGAAVYAGAQAPNNLGAEGGLGVQWTLYDWEGTRFWTGLALNALAFDQNLRFFTLGHGGYFSPQVFMNVGVPFGLKGGTAQTVRYEVGGNIGVNWFREDPAPWYPTDPARQQARAGLLDIDDGPVEAYYAGRESVALGLTASGQVVVPVSDNFDIGVRAGVYFGDEYVEAQGGLWLAYTFQKKVEVSPLLRPYDPSVATDASSASAVAVGGR